MISLDNKSAVITGGNSGMGFATAQKFKELGANVIITGRNPTALAQAANELGVKAIVADQANLQDLDNLVDQVKTQFGSIDYSFY